MGIKMLKVRTISPCIDRNAEDLTDADRDNIMCCYCTALVTLVCKSKREVVNGTEYVSRFLRLRQRHEHQSECEYLVDSAIEQLVAKSDCADEALGLLVREHTLVVFRLHVLDEAEWTAREEASRHSIDEIDKPINGRRYVKTTHQLANYLRTAAGIARLRALVMDRSKSELESMVKLVSNGLGISWNKFYYDDTRYRDIVDAADESGYLPHLIAVEVSPRETQTNGTSRIKCIAFGEKRESVQGRPVITIPFVDAPEAVCRQLVCGYTYILVARVRVSWDKKSRASESGPIFQYINIPLFHASQFHRLGSVRQHFNELRPRPHVGGAQ